VATSRCNPLVLVAALRDARPMSRSWFVILAVSAVACGTTAKPAVRHFDDDYESARLEAVRSKLPLVVEVWAPW
jgi:hypothetical protein